VRTVFADTWFYLALLDAGDHHHKTAKSYLRSFDGRFVTTRWILAEVANGLAAPRFRLRVAEFLERLESNRRVQVFGESDELYRDGRALYKARPDKEWSLTDCISFVVMEREGIREALTADHHFKQAGFVGIFESGAIG
jgi:hypothetical protein